MALENEINNNCFIDRCLYKQCNTNGNISNASKRSWCTHVW